MRALMIVTGLALIGGYAVAATAMPRKPRTSVKAPASPSAICLKLSAGYENASKSLAGNVAKGIGDNSAPRATMREAENNNILAQARLTIDLLKENGCQMPTAAPSATRYFSAALKCKNDQLDMALGRGPIHIPDSCDSSKWTPAN
jgi:hypothetical protein